MESEEQSCVHIALWITAQFSHGGQSLVRERGRAPQSIEKEIGKEKKTKLSIASTTAHVHLLSSMHANTEKYGWLEPWRFKGQSMYVLCIYVGREPRSEAILLA